MVKAMLLDEVGVFHSGRQRRLELQRRQAYWASRDLDDDRI